MSSFDESILRFISLGKLKCIDRRSLCMYLSLVYRYDFFFSPMPSASLGVE